MRKTVALLLIYLLAPMVWASSINDISFAELPNQHFEVRLKFDQTPPAPKGYTIETPARIVLDFPGAVSDLTARRFPLAFNNGKSAMVLTSGDRTRLIINLNKLTTYSSRVDGDDFVVEVGANGGKYAAAADKTSAGASAPAANSAPTHSDARSISNIDFRRGEHGEGRIIVDLSSSSMSADMKDTADGLKITFKNASLPSKLRRRLDVLDFATPVSVVSANSKHGNTVIDVKAKGDYDYLAYQADNKYVVSVKPLTKKEKADKKDEFKYTGKRLSFNFQDIEVRAVLQIIADFTHLNLVASDTVKGKITMRLDNVPWDQALDLVLKTKGLDKRKVGNVLMVAPAAEIAERERQELSTKRQLQELAPLHTEYIRVRYADARDIYSLLKSGDKKSGSDDGSDSDLSGSVLSARGHASVDKRTNSIIVTDTADHIEAVKKLVGKIDIPVRQVMIEARLVIANENFRNELGIRWGGSGAHQGSDSLVAVGASSNSLNNNLGSMPNTPPSANSPSDFLYGGGSADLNNNMSVDLGVQDPVGTLALGFLADNSYLDLELSALESNGYAEIVSQPKVITADKQEASVSTGSEIPYQEASASGATSASYKEVVLELKVTPQITPDNNIIMDLAIKKDLISEYNELLKVPILDITRLNTKVLVGDGQTVVLGGIFQMQKLKTVDKVPLLGDIPFLGRLFRRNVINNKKNELLIFITPRILADNVTTQ